MSNEEGGNPMAEHNNPSDISERELLVRIDERTKTIKDTQDSILGRLVPLETYIVKAAERWDNHEKEHSEIRRKSNLADYGSYLVAVIGATISGVIGTKT